MRDSGTDRSSASFARFLSVLTAFLASSLPAPGGRTEEHGGSGARRDEPPQTNGTLAGWRGFFVGPRMRRASRGASRSRQLQPGTRAGIDDDDERPNGRAAEPGVSGARRSAAAEPH